MRIDNDVKLDFDDVLIIPKRTVLVSRADVDLVREYRLLHSRWKLSCVPIIAANMDSVGTMKMAKKMHSYKALTSLHKYYTVEELCDFLLDDANWACSFYTMGMNECELDKWDQVFAMMSKKKDFMSGEIMPRMICIDVANGYSQKFVEHVKRVREKFSNSMIMAGNVVTPNMVEELLLSGADIVKCGIGGGSCCTTRLVAGVGYPQLSTIDECADAAHGLGGLICSDGGCRTPGDVAKAFAAGADFVMLGGMLSGTDECEGEWIEEDGKKLLKFHGMSSKEAQEKWNGGLAEYRAAEGKEVKIPYRGSVETVIQQILGGIRSACTYTGARRLKDLPKCASFVRVSRTHNTVYSQ